MKVITIDYFFDGGTAKIETDKGCFYCDGRMDTNTKNEIYSQHPDDSGSKIVDRKIARQLFVALEEFINSGSSSFCPECDKTLLAEMIK